MASLVSTAEIIIDFYCPTRTFRPFLSQKTHNFIKGRGCVLEEAEWRSTRAAFISFVQALLCWCLDHLEKDTKEETLTEVDRKPVWRRNR